MITNDYARIPPPVQKPQSRPPRLGLQSQGKNCRLFFLFLVSSPDFVSVEQNDFQDGIPQAAGDDRELKGKVLSATLNLKFFIPVIIFTVAVSLRDTVSSFNIALSKKDPAAGTTIEEGKKQKGWEFSSEKFETTLRHRCSALRGKGYTFDIQIIKGG